MSIKFSANFADGYIFRNLIEYLKNTNQSGIFLFSKERILYKQSNAISKIVNKIEIRCEDLVSYEYNSSEEQIPVSVNFVDILTILRNTGKKDSIKIFQRTDEPSILYFQSKSHTSIDGESSNENISMIRLQYLNPLEFDESANEIEEKNPNVVIQNSMFNKVFKTFSSMKCDSISIIGKNKGIMLISISKGEIFGRIEKIGEISEDIGNIEKLESDPDYSVIKVSCSTMKSLCKIGNLGSIIKIYMEKNKPLKIVTNIGSFGNLKSYVITENQTL